MDYQQLPSYKLKKWLKNIVIVSLFIGIITYYLAIQYPLKSFTIENISLDGRGGECPIFSLYDDRGMAHETYIDIVSYSGLAPLYYIDPHKLNAQETIPGCYEFPQQIHPSLISEGLTVYPLDVDISVSSGDWIGAGESAILIADARFSDHYSEQSFAIPISETESINTILELYSTNFEFSPKNESSLLNTLSLDFPVQQRWIIAPIDNVMGKQYLEIMVRLEGHYSIPIIVEVGVRPLYGINPSTLAIIAALGSGILGLLAIISQSIGIWEKIKDLQNKKSKTRTQHLKK